MQFESFHWLRWLDSLKIAKIVMILKTLPLTFLASKSNTWQRKHIFLIFSLHYVNLFSPLQQ